MIIHKSIISTSNNPQLTDLTPEIPIQSNPIITVLTGITFYGCYRRMSLNQSKTCLDKERKQTFEMTKIVVITRVPLYQTSMITRSNEQMREVKLNRFDPISFIQCDWWQTAMRSSITRTDFICRDQGSITKLMFKPRINNF